MKYPSFVWVVWSVAGPLNHFNIKFVLRKSLNNRIFWLKKIIPLEKKFVWLPLDRFQNTSEVVSFCHRQKSCSKLQSAASWGSHEYVDNVVLEVAVVDALVVVDKPGSALAGRMLQFVEEKNFKSSKAMSPKPAPLVAKIFDV